MARKMDSHADLIAQLEAKQREIKKHTAEANAIINPLKKEEEVLQARLLKSMNGSLIGTVKDKPRIEVYNSARETATRERVLLYAPEKVDLICTKGYKPKIKIV
ncbi:hypothetical protein FDI69_gp218 [Rhodococcus phage Trina]|uniref:Uncharacterized protein n=1 Tax=Rhodococcus phage Trina TaxID=2027905 RepID=A0A2D0ZNL5_9CAUD|nr:hypothetical protein FDI69_gp218 [Rhodococcus phage Trina]ASZ74968.1 hypothetical protein SEA_TRINA_184 [Rhodococcus phage Trina]